MEGKKERKGQVRKLPLLPLPLLQAFQVGELSRTLIRRGLLY